ncbi:uncharacterized protein BJ171DRAFT_482638 [Polychytrium aggregatum]|uniref:uncharacterized protein n=1 Tax=Polychytrium aggregatum TaxID=110093 RepID=UPI0022FDC5C3|nr:uncharacterized protein BJ171DRAFT_482638 [Polychytrium aggregatum]KAI9190543.1 hypothetical protein BJ171DRAFT_482638 [Polychytrium aggregatum]
MSEPVLIVSEHAPQTSPAHPSEIAPAAPADANTEPEFAPIIPLNKVLITNTDELGIFDQSRILAYFKRLNSFSHLYTKDEVTVELLESIERELLSHDEVSTYCRLYHDEPDSPVTLEQFAATLEHYNPENFVGQIMPRVENTRFYTVVKTFIEWSHKIGKTKSVPDFIASAHWKGALDTSDFVVSQIIQILHQSPFGTDTPVKRSQLPTHVYEFLNRVWKFIAHQQATTEAQVSDATMTC